MPKQVKDKNKLERIMKANEERRAKVKEESKQKTLASERPFSFYQRDKDSSNKAAKQLEQDALQFQPFRARPPPSQSCLNLLERLERER